MDILNMFQGWVGIAKIHGVLEKAYQADPGSMNKHVERSVDFYGTYLCCTDNFPVQPYDLMESFF